MTVRVCPRCGSPADELLVRRLTEAEERGDRFAKQLAELTEAVISPRRRAALERIGASLAQLSALEQTPARARQLTLVQGGDDAS